MVFDQQKLNKNEIVEQRTLSTKVPYIKYVGEGGRDFAGPMKYFSKFLMGHKIFSFLCWILAILFFKLKGSEHKISKLAMKKT